jgi:lysyl endopeptidase
MRRTIGVVAGASAVLVMAGGAYAVSLDVPAKVTGSQPAAMARPTPSGDEPGVRPAAPTRPDARTATTGGRPEVTGEPVRQRIGTLQNVTGLLGYLGGSTRQTFHFPGASYVKLHFDRLLLLPGDYVTVSDPSGAEMHRYEAPPLAAGLLSRLLSGTASAPPTARWAMSITGDTAVLELHRVGSNLLGLGAVLGRLGVGVNQVARGYTLAERVSRSAPEGRRSAAAAEPAAAKPAGGEPAAAEPAAPGPGGPGRTGRTGREESVCGSDQKADAVCFRSKDPVAYTRSKAVARLLINGVELCTGWRVGAGNRMLTNNHCFDSSDDAYETEVWFNYQCARCGGYEVFRSTKVWGDRVLATNRTLDFTVFTVENFGAVKRFGHLLLDERRPPARETLFVPQHPGGDPTMIAGIRGERAGNCAVVDPAYDGYATDSDVSYYCDTEGGSSGSPVISRRTNKVVALHHFGGCPNSGVRADLIYRKIRRLI